MVVNSRVVIWRDCASLRRAGRSWHRHINLIICEMHNGGCFCSVAEEKSAAYDFGVGINPTANNRAKIMIRTRVGQAFGVESYATWGTKSWRS